MLFLQPVYFTSLVPYDTTEEDNQETGKVEEEEEDAVKTQEGEATEEPAAQSDGGKENDNEKEGEGGENRRDESPALRFETYKEAVKKYCLHHADNDMVGTPTLHKPSCKVLHTRQQITNQINYREKSL